MALSPVAIILIASAVVVLGVFRLCYKRRLRYLKKKKRDRIRRSAAAGPAPCSFPHFSHSDTHLPQHHAVNGHVQYKNPISPYTHPVLSSKSLRLADEDTSDDQEKNCYNQSQVQDQPRNPSPSPANIPVSPGDMELSPLPAVHRNPSTRQSQLANHRFSPSLPSQPKHEILPAVEDGISRRVDSYFANQSPLPRPLNMQRPVITDTSVTSSSKVVATIVRSVKRQDATNDKQVIEPEMVVIKQSPPLVALRSQSPWAKTTQDQLETTPSLHPSHSAVYRDELITSDDPFMAKEEVHRKAPQAILPEGYQHPQHSISIPIPLDIRSGNGCESMEDSGDESSDGMNTAFLMLGPYLPPAEFAPPVPNLNSPLNCTAEASSSLPPTPTPTRPPRRTPSIQRHPQGQCPDTARSGQPNILSAIQEVDTSAIITPASSIDPSTTTLSSSTPTPLSRSSPSPTPLFHTRGPGPSRFGRESPAASTTDSERTISPAPSHASSGHRSSISTIVSSVSNATSNPGTHFRSKNDSPVPLSPTMMQASPTNATVYSPTTPSSARSTGFRDRRPIDDPWSKRGNDREKSCEPKLQDAWLHHPPSPGTKVSDRKRENHPQDASGAGASLSQFNYGD
ncbi:hypothetical protein BGZ50_009727 [Haplosporangium sp. Z 11]|nr:hypothetical protein BGZ50_009727 [Haplosporangium sp. Z 11]